MEVVASLSQGRTAAAQCGLFTHKSVRVIFEPLCIIYIVDNNKIVANYKSKKIITITKLGPLSCEFNSCTEILINDVRVCG